MPSFVIDGDPTWSPNSEFVAYTEIIRTDCAGIVVMNVEDSFKRECLTINKTYLPSWNIVLSWSPDGQFIVFRSPINDNTRDLYIIKTNGTNMTDVTNVFGDVIELAWSSVPYHIVYHAITYLTNLQIA